MSSQPQRIQALWDEGLQAFQQDDLEVAKSNFQSLLLLNPKHFDCLYLSSVIANQEGNLSLALELLWKAFRLDSSRIDVLFNIAVLLSSLEKYEYSLDAYNAILERDPNHIQALYNKASLKAKLGFVEDALYHLEQVVAISPNFEAAKINLEQLKAVASNTFITIMGGQNSNPNLKEEHFQKLHDKGLALFEKRDLINAIEHFNQALLLKPKSLHAHHNLGMALEKMGRLQDALNCYEQALDIDPKSAPTLNNMGNIYRDLGALDKAETHFIKAIEIQPDYADALNNLGWTYYTMRQFKKAMDCYDKALELKPDLIETKYNMGLCQLMLGDFENGWLNYDYRKLQPNHQRYVDARGRPEWLGYESLENKTIYIYPEQGLGDTLQFSRYLKLLIARGGNVLFNPGPSLISLFENFDPAIKLIYPGHVIPEYDFHCSLMSLPLAFKSTLENIPKNMPYLFADAKKIDHWSKKILPIRGPKIGLVWNGGFRANQPELWELNKRRNIPFEMISKLNITDMNFFSLQKGKEAEEQLKEVINSYWPNQDNFYNFTSDLHDFSDTAAHISQLDLIISVDTSTAHLAGGMGKPVWILNRFDSCWRWLESGEKSDWYPSVKLYRKEHAENWYAVIEKVKLDLCHQFNKEYVG